MNDDANDSFPAVPSDFIEDWLDVRIDLMRRHAQRHPEIEVDLTELIREFQTRLDEKDAEITALRGTR